MFVSAFLFTIMHGGPEQTVHQFILGVVFGYIFVTTGNLWVTILIHFFNNAIAVTLMFVEGVKSTTATEALPEASVGFDGLSSLEIISSVFIALIMAVAAVLLIRLIIKAIQKQQEKLNNVEMGNQISVQEESAKDEAIVVKNNNDRVVGSFTTITMFVLSTAWLIYEWVITLIAGF